MKFILGKKMPMTQVWANDKVWAVTPVAAGPCVVTQVKTAATDKYSALQLAYGVRKEKNIKKPQLGHFKKAGVAPMHVREFRTEGDVAAKVGDKITAGTFAAGDIVAVTGTSKGRGFQGVVKRYHFAGGRKSHGNKDQLRMPGSVGAKGPAHIFKGMRMGGRMGNERVTVTNLEIASVDLEKNIIYIKGALPGAAEGLLLIKGQGELAFNIAPVAEEVVVPEVAVEEVKEETVVTEEAPVETAEVKEEVAEVKEEVVAEEKKEEAQAA